MTPEPPPCKICSQSAVRIGETRNFQSATRVLHHWRCTGCGLVFVGNLIDATELAKAYASFDHDEYYSEIGNENGRKFDSAVADLKVLADADSRILDLGTGNGGFLLKLLDAGFRHVDGQDIPGAPLTEPERRGCRIYRDADYATIPSASYDIVTLLDVAEHVVDPDALFRACHRILRPGGRVYFHTPVVTRLDRLMHAVQRVPGLRRVGQAWQRGRTSIFHLQNYTPAALHTVLTRAGFEKPNVVVRNELSWPVASYVKVYLCQKLRLPDWTAPLLAPLFRPILASERFNPNKAVGSAVRGVQSV